MHMTLPLSASRLVRFATCERAYAWKYRYHYPEPSGGGRQQKLGIALHATLHSFWKDWLVRGGQSIEHLHRLWNRQVDECGLEAADTNSGWLALEGYYCQEVGGPQPPRPFATEGRICHSLVLDRVDVRFESRYDLLLWGTPRAGAAQIDLVEFKTARQVRTLTQLEADLQLSCYILGLAATYGEALRSVSHYYLLSGEKLTFQVQPYHQDYALSLTRKLVGHLLDRRPWQPEPGRHCRRCGYRNLCDLSQPDQSPPASPGYARPEEPVVLSLF